MVNSSIFAEHEHTAGVILSNKLSKLLFSSFEMKHCNFIHISRYNLEIDYLKLPLPVDMIR